MDKVIKIGHIKVDSSLDRNSYFKIRGQSKVKQRALVYFGGVFKISNVYEQLNKLGFYNIEGMIDDFSHYRAEISFKDIDKLKIIRKW